MRDYRCPRRDARLIYQLSTPVGVEIARTTSLIRRSIEIQLLGKSLNQIVPLLSRKEAKRIYITYRLMASPRLLPLLAIKHHRNSHDDVLPPVPLGRLLIILSISGSDQLQASTCPTSSWK